MYEIFEQLCKINGVTAYKVSKETGVTTATLTSWKQGKYTPKDEKLQKLADFFNVTVEYLKTGSDSRIDVPAFDEEHIEVLSLYSGLNKDQQKLILQLMRELKK